MAQRGQRQRSAETPRPVCALASICIRFCTANPSERGTAASLCMSTYVYGMCRDRAREAEGRAAHALNNNIEHADGDMCGGTHGKGDVRSRSHTPTTYTLAQGHPAPRRDLAGPRQSSACQGQATATCALREETAGLLRHLWLRAEPDRVPGHANNAGVKMRAWLGRLCAPHPPSGAVPIHSGTSSHCMLSSSAGSEQKNHCLDGSGASSSSTM